MSKKEFDEFLNKHQAQLTLELKLDWEKERDEWLFYLNDFYSRIEKFLKNIKKKEKSIFNIKRKKFSKNL